MQVAVEIDVLQHFASIGFESGAEIVQVNTGRFLHHPIGDAGGNLTGDGVIDSLLAPAARDVVAFFDFFEQKRDVVRIVLKVTIERNDHIA